MLALLAMLTSGRTCVDMEDFGREREERLRQYLTLENGIPSHDTFSRLFRKLDPAGLQRALLRLAQDWADELGDVVAVDGKALRRSFETASERSPTHLLLTVRGGGEADAGAGGGGRQVERDTGAAGTARREGAHGDRGRVYAQRGSAAAIVAKGGDYALQLTRNQGAMHADVVEYLDNPAPARPRLSEAGADPRDPRQPLGARLEGDPRLPGDDPEPLRVRVHAEARLVAEPGGVVLRQAGAPPCVEGTLRHGLDAAEFAIDQVTVDGRSIARVKVVG